MAGPERGSRGFPGRMRSLRAFLVVRVLLPVAAVLGVAILVGLHVLEREVEARMEDDVELVARALRLPLIHALERDREGSVMQALQSALQIRRVYGVHIFDPEGERIASLGAGVPEDPPETVHERAAAGEEVGEYGSLAGRRLYSYFVPLHDPWGRSLGVLQVTRTRSDVEATLGRIRALGIGALVAGTILVSLLVLLGHRRAVGRPLEILQASMRRVRAGEKGHRAGEGGPREVSELARTFNSMLDAVDSAQAEVAARRRAQAQLETELAQAEKLAAVGELAGGLAHELGSPLSVIDGKAQRLLRRPGEGAEAEAALRQIRGEVRRMEGILRRLLEFGRSGGGRRQLVGVDQLVRSAVTATAEEARARGTDVEVRGGAGPAPVVAVEPRRVEEALGNLLRNGCQAAPGGRVRVTWWEEGEGACLRVEDDGAGVPGEVASRIFEPFFTTKGVGEGTGLGLAVVHGVISDHGGEVTFGGSELGGAAFRVTLPRVEAPGGVEAGAGPEMGAGRV